MELEIETLQKVLNNLVKEYQKNPIEYFYEEDIRADLLIKLRSENIFDIALPITKKNEWLGDYVEILGDVINISGIKAEYPSNTRFDIAYIKPNNEKNHYIFECPFAIEIKLSQKDSKNRDFKLDIEKLLNYKTQHPNFIGIAIDFGQSPVIKKEDLDKNYGNFKMTEFKKGIEISKGLINYFFITKKEIFGGNPKTVTEAYN